MCPDRQILSVFFDGELPSPWKEKMELHVSGCDECREKLEGYRNIHRSLNETGLSGGEFDARMENARERLWAELSRPKIESPGREASRYPIWRRSVTIPFPAAVAALLVVLFLAALLMRTPGNVAVPESAVASIGTELHGVLPVSDMSGVLQYLESQESTTDIVIIRLPESKQFVPAGEPTLVRAADYTRRIGQP